MARGLWSQAISAGQRWVLVVFLIAQGVPQLGRRCAEAAALAKAHAQALRRAGGGADEADAALTQADAALAAALSVSPADHELHHALAGLHAMNGALPAARASLRTAAALYPKCPKPRTALGSMLIAAERYRGALRHFEAAFALAPPSRPPEAAAHGADRGAAGALEPVPIADDDAWEAAVNGALCIVELLGARGRAPRPAAQAVAWLEGALAAAPGEPRLVALLERAQTLAQQERAAVVG